MDKVKITWTVTRKFGHEDVTLTLEAEEAFGSVLIATDLLQSKAIDIFKHYINNYVPKMQSQPGIGQQKTNVEILPAERLGVEAKDGKRLFKVYGGKFSKHGVPFYDEHIKAGNVQPEDIPDVGWDLKGKYNYEVEMDGKSPKRVLRLIKVTK